MSIFNYESKFTQTLLFLADLMILNVLYVICCIPVFTIGAAQAGLHAGIRVMTDPEDDSSIAKAFFKAFANGFGKVTIAWGLMGLVIAALVYFGYIAIAFGSPLWPIGISLGIAAWLQSTIPPLHSRFYCTPMQLIRNAFLFNLAHPLRTLGAAVLLWLPVILFMSPLTYYFLAAGPLWVILYYSVAVLFGASFLKKPLTNLVNRFKESAAEQTQEEAPAIEE